MHERICSYLTLTLLAVTLSACGGSSAAPTASHSDRERVAAQGPPECQSLISDFVASLDRLRGRLVGETTYPQYVAGIKEAHRSYENLPVKRLPEACLKGPAVLAEDTFNSYIKAANTWAKCLADNSCDIEAVMPVVEKMWWAAGLSLSRVHAALPGLPAAYAEGLPDYR